jgi:AcrR family transcriptional regulator
MPGHVAAKSKKRRKTTGRRPGRANSRGAILEAARARFARYGYDTTTIRGVAADAGVDPALVMQFYGSKEGLFAAILEEHTSVTKPLLAVLAGARTGLGERFTRAYLELWEDPVSGDQLRSLIRAVIGSPSATRMFQGLLEATLTRSAIPARRRLPSLLAASHLLGTAIARYIIQVPVLVAPSLDELVPLLSPAIDGYLNAE